MTTRELKELLNKIPEDDLDKEIVIMLPNLRRSGICNKILVTPISNSLYTNVDSIYKIDGDMVGVFRNFIPI